MKERFTTTPDGYAAYVTIDGDTVDFVAYSYYGEHGKNTEAVYTTNPDLASAGLVLPAGMVVRLPPAPPKDQPKAFRRLWD